MPAANAAGIFLSVHQSVLITPVPFASDNSLTLRNARAVLPDRVLSNSTIEIVDGRIARITESRDDAPLDGPSTDLAGLTVFSFLCFCAIIGLGLVKTRWRTTWGLVAQARI